MKWEKHSASNYAETVLELLERELVDSETSIQPLFNLILNILENVHDHGSGCCKVMYGRKDDKVVVEIFEELGGFDLKKLPHGVGGEGYKTILRSDYEVSHSPDGKRTFIVEP